ncbi:MAG: serine hydroxymethyltransferase [bacterium]|nr:serine hydroxymethyltransferase [bacterium]
MKKTRAVKKEKLVKQKIPKTLSLAELNRLEEKRQQSFLTLIASENYVSKKVREAMSSVFANKYSEGYPGKRYYPGNEIVDQMETRVQNLAREVFGLKEDEWHVNVQPASGSGANFASYYGFINYIRLRLESERNEKLSFHEAAQKYSFLGMKLAHGGHLTHGHPINATGTIFKFAQYGTDAEGMLDMNEVVKLAREHQPKLIVWGITAYPRKPDFARFKEIARSVGALFMVDMAHVAGLVASGVHENPFLYADIVTTTTHKSLRGPRGAMIFVRKKIGFQNKDPKRGVVSLADQIDRAVFPGLQGGPHDHQTYAIGVALEEALKPEFKKYGEQIVKNAKALAEELVRRGITLMSGGTDNHLMLIDLRSLGISGKEAEERLVGVGITANRNTVPGDASAFNPSGIRIGTPAVTTRGMKEKEMKVLAEVIAGVLTRNELSAMSKKVKALCGKFRA